MTGSAAVIDRVVLPASAGGHPLTVTVALPSAPPRGTFLYLHGFRSEQDGEKARFFRACATRGGHAFASFDFRGHGASGGTPLDLTLTGLLADLAAVRAHLAERGLGPLVLLGSSLGGAVGLWGAALEPGGVEAGVFLAPALDLGVRLEAWAGDEGLVSWRETGRRRWRDEGGEVDLPWALVEDLRRYPLDRLAELTVRPALLLQGRQDDSVGWRGAVELFVRVRRGALDLHLFADGDHRLVDRLDYLWELTERFLARAVPGPR